MSKGDKVSLPERMREAAKVLQEADRRCHGRIEGWTPQDLEGTAEAWEAEDRAKAEQDAMVEQLYADLLKVWTDELPSALARRLIAAGWRKGSSDE